MFPSSEPADPLVIKVISLFVAALKEKLVFTATTSLQNHFYSHITINMLYLWVCLNGAVMESYFLFVTYHLKSDPNRVIKCHIDIRHIPGFLLSDFHSNRHKVDTRKGLNEPYEKYVIEKREERLKADQPKMCYSSL